MSACTGENSDIKLTFCVANQQRHGRDTGVTEVRVGIQTLLRHIDLVKQQRTHLYHDETNRRTLRDSTILEEKTATSCVNPTNPHHNETFKHAIIEALAAGVLGLPVPAAQ